VLDDRTPNRVPRRTGSSILKAGKNSPWRHDKRAQPLARNLPRTVKASQHQAADAALPAPGHDSNFPRLVKRATYKQGSSRPDEATRAARLDSARPPDSSKATKKQIFEQQSVDHDLQNVVVERPALHLGLLVHPGGFPLRTTNQQGRSFLHRRLISNDMKRLQELSTLRYHRHRRKRGTKSARMRHLECRFTEINLPRGRRRLGGSLASGQRFRAKRELPHLQVQEP